jgi:hypothetical protein
MRHYSLAIDALVQAATFEAVTKCRANNERLGRSAPG